MVEKSHNCLHGVRAYKVCFVNEEEIKVLAANSLQTDSTVVRECARPPQINSRAQPRPAARGLSVAMNAHLANEARYDVRRDAARPRGLVHVIITDECLEASGVPREMLMGGADQWGESSPSFRVMTQVREHATGDCLPWEDAFAAYMPLDALGDVLAPTIPSHPLMLERTPSPGGLFVSLPVGCDGGGRFDPYATTALRVAWGATRKRSRVLLFSHGELVPADTRYTADRPRLALLCRHFCRYVAQLGGAAPPAAVEAASHLAMGLEEPAPTPREGVLPISPEGILTDPGKDDAGGEVDSMARENEEILELVRRAAVDASSRLPVRLSSRPCVASGLKQKALLHPPQARVDTTRRRRGHRRARGARPRPVSHGRPRAGGSGGRINSRAREQAAAVPN
ncbi:DNA packaging tegument protein UL17 [Leporid alphaherpesvirus 4]|uniref:DNA packaging tegument protein UL17 n=1 Tax=Leporid alphaherpesvirus 4 TaxID=481315 RepID=J9QYM5_9ALPH|nr:DNA packaging tegument protein UL17 [Leporid alphaherpesvirus 4]AFR32458.1 DNA packaging tegument protein UL17 [Leporid alphaherpesvirus 4]